MKNLDKNLYEVDSMTERKIREKEATSPYDRHRRDHLADEFHEFYLQRLTKVKDADRYATMLKGFYEKRMKEVRRELDSTQAELIKEQSKARGTAQSREDKEREQLTADYEKLLIKREKYRMETYGFNWTETGWVNIDNGDMPKPWGSGPLEVIVENSSSVDRLYTYVIYKSIKSLYRLNTDDQHTFYTGNATERQMLMPKEADAVAFAIGYKNDSPFVAVQTFTTNKDSKLSMTLLSSSTAKVTDLIRQYEEDYPDENRISVDIKYMAEFYKDRQRLKEKMKDREFLTRLWQLVHPCCEAREQLPNEPYYIR